MNVCILEYVLNKRQIQFYFYKKLSILQKLFKECDKTCVNRTNLFSNKH